MATPPGLGRTTPLHPQSFAIPNECDVLGMGSAGDLAAARAVARGLLQFGGPSDASAETILQTLLLTAACLHAAYIVQDDITVADVVALLRALRPSSLTPVELHDNPLPFVRYVDAELRNLEAAVAEDALGRILAGLGAQPRQSDKKPSDLNADKSLDVR